MSGQKGWPLDVYRRSSRGWQKQIPAGFEEYHNLKPNAMGKAMEGCVLVKRYRLKIKLQDKKAGLTEVVRRNKCLLFTPQSARHCQILLKFPSRKDCLAFSDELMILNKTLYETAKNTAKNAGPQMDAGAAKKGTTEDATNPADRAAGVQRSEMFHQIVQLVHDESFLAFAAKIENLIQSSPDGEKILQALGT